MSSLITRRSRTARAFSLIELLVVLLILTILISIVVPTLQSIRNTSRKAVTTDMMAQLATVVSQFKISQNRLPGYFSPKDMGDSANAGGMGTGFTGMENLLLDLAGGITTAATDNGNNVVCDVLGGPKIVEVGPLTAGKARVDIGRIGAAAGGASGEVSRGYYKPDPKFFVRQCGPGQRGVGATQLHSAMPVLVDAWGSPILAWVQDEVPETGFAFSAADATARAKFYAASNVGFTRATSLGKLTRNQETDSLLGQNNGFSATSYFRSLEGLLGNPTFPGLARSPVIFHSAGANGVYLGKEERGAKSLASGPGYLPFINGRDVFTEGDFDDFVIKAE